MFDLPARTDVREVIITPDSINEGTAPLVVTERPRQKKEA
jgi:ATP-dependent protease Clp ATPase subunit